MMRFSKMRFSKFAYLFEGFAAAATVFTLSLGIARSDRRAMRKLQWLVALTLLTFAPTAIRADVFSYSNTLSSPEDAVEYVIVLATAGTVGLQTYGFGGGTNAAGTTIAPGGTDPFVAIFSGTGDGAMIVTDGFGNPYGTSLVLSNYGNPNFSGCGPGLAGAPTIGGSPQCGDITMTIPSLAAGTYTVVLSDGQYIANAVFDNGTLGEGFSDFTGGVFCNIDVNGVACPDPLGGAYALDITTPETTVTPEPATYFALCAILLLLTVTCKVYVVRRHTPPCMATETSRSLLGVGSAAAAGLNRFRKRRTI